MQNLISQAKCRQFGLTMGVFFIAFFGFLMPLFLNKPLPSWPWALSAAFVSAALLMPYKLRPVYIIWMKIGHILGTINSRLIMAILYFLLFLPMGFVMRILGKDPLFSNYDPSAISYRISSKKRDPKDLEKPY